MPMEAAPVSRRLGAWRLGRFVLAALLALSLYYCFPFAAQHVSPIGQQGGLSPGSRRPRNALVVASMLGDNTSWTLESFPEWDVNVYVADDPEAALTVPLNKGRESNVYLSYIIQNYDNLPDISIYIHGRRYQWHNDHQMYDGIPVIRNLQLGYVLDQGYANLRCAWSLGCPADIIPQDPSSPPRNPNADTEIEYARAFAELFPGVPVPGVVGVPCGSQMALSRDKIRERPVEDYIRYRQWLLETQLPDSTSGRIFEYSWHMIMGKPAVYCLNAESCYCQKFGFCDLNCTADRCEKRYILPKFATIPEGWPEEGTGVNGWPENDWWTDN